VGHNPGPFTPLVRAHVGDLVRYWDLAGAAHTYRITGIDRIPAAAASAYMTDNAHPHLVLQTCATPDATEYFEYVAYPV
jgi:sortase (surface protein transpeptidase)